MEFSFNLSSSIFIVTALTGLVFLVVGMIVYIKPPQNINDFYGYRTARSKKNIDAWDFAQIYSSRLMIFWGLALLIIGILGGFVRFGELIDVAISLVIVFFSCGHLLYKTERALIQRERNQVK